MSDSSVGKELPPQDLRLKVTGTADYTFDLSLLGMLYCKIVTSTVPHARIKSIEKHRAESVEGVVSILTGKDMPYRVGMYAGDRDLLAVEKVRWVGHPLAVVVAETIEAAERAAELVDVEYEELPAVFDPLEALKDGAPLLHENMHEYRHSPAFNPVPGTNIANRFTLVHGDVEKGFQMSDVIIEDEFRISHVSHAYMETQNVIAYAKRDGTVEIWTSCQSPFIVRQILAESLNIPYNNIVVKTPFVGGGFGGKAGLGWEALATVVSMKVGFKPVRLILSRKENFVSSASREGVIAKVKAGFTKEGKCLAYKVRFVLDAGAYADYTVNVSRAMGYSAEGVYEIPNVECESLAVYTNKVPTTAMRGFGYPESNWVLEQVFERAAAKLGLDSVRIRRLNLLKPGESSTATGEKLREDVGDPRKVLQTLLQEIEWYSGSGKPSKPWRIRSKGIALCVKGPSQPPNASSSAIVKFNEDSTIDLVVGTTNFGQGTVTSLSQIVADEFGIPVEKVRVDFVRDTSKSAYTWQTVGSRGLFTDGIATIRACNDAKRQIKAIASQVLRVPEEELEIQEGRVFVRSRPWLSLYLKDVVFGYVYPNGNTIGGPIIGRGNFSPTLNTYLDPTTGQGIPTIFHTFGGTAVEIEMDPLTGEIFIEKAVQVFDVGKAINPLLLKMQTEGGFIMGMSIALFEKIKFDELGNVLNPNFTGYYVARMKDMPEKLVSRFVETPQYDGPLGARGIGELGMISVASAISNAIFLATGVKLNNLPMNPEYVWTEIGKQRPELISNALEKFFEIKQEAKAK